MDERSLAYLRSLAARDRELAEHAAELREQDAAAARVRARAEEVGRFFAAYPAEDDARRAAVHEAATEVERQTRMLAEAETALAAAEDPDHAAKAVRRARDHLAVAESALLRARSAHDELERKASDLPAALAALEADAGVRGTDALVEWAAARHAELFVELGQVDLQRERVIREANELASMLLDSPTYGSTVEQALAQVLRRSAGQSAPPPRAS